DPATGEISALAPNTTEVTVELNPEWAAVRSSTVPLTVIPGTFAGTAVQGAYGAGQAVTFTAGAVPFDEETEVTFSTDWGHNVTLWPASETELVALLPYGLPAGTTFDYSILTGDGVAVGGTFTTTAATPADDPYGDTFTTTPVIQIGEDVVGAVGATGDEELLHFTVTEAGSYRLDIGWSDTSDLDVYITDPDANVSYLARETTA